MTTHSPPAPGGRTGEPTRRSVDGVAGERSRPPRGLRCRVRLADGRVFCGELPAERHRALHLGLLHSQSNGLVELAAGTRRDGTLQIHTRARADHFLPGGATGTPDGSRRCSRSRPSHADRGEELFIAPAVRSQRARREARRRAHPRAVGRRRPARTAAPPVGAPRRAALPPAGRERRRGRARLLAARQAAPSHRSEPARGLAGRADRARPRADHPPPRRRWARPAERRRPGVPRSQPAHAAGRHGERQDRPATPGSSRPTSSSPPTRSSSSSATSPTRRQPRHARDDIGGESSTRTRTSGSPRPSTSSNSPGSRYRAAGWSLPGALARRPAPVVLGRSRLDTRLEMPRLRLRRGRRDLRPRLGPARRPVGPPAARRAVQTRPRLRRRRLRRTHLTPSNPHEGSLDAHAHP